MVKLKKVLSEHYKLVGFVIATVILLTDLLVCNCRECYYDSGGYNIMAEYFKQNGLFNFNLYLEEGTIFYGCFSIRGYAWPLILAICKTLGLGTYEGCWLFYSLFLAAGLSYALPDFIEEIFEKKVGFFARLIPVCLTIMFWNGLIIYPLSDLPAVITVSFGLMFLAKISNKNKMFKNSVLAFLMGICFGLSYYIRSGCITIIVIAIIIVLFTKMKKEYIKKIALILLMIAGLSVSALPQIAINVSCNKVMSYKVPIFLKTDIADSEYYNSFAWVRYDTNVGNKYPGPVLYSRSSVLDNILAVEDIDTSDVDVFTIIEMFFKYPLEFIGMYTVKFVTCLDPRYGNQGYVKDINWRQYFIVIINYLLWFISFLGIGLSLSKEKLETKHNQLNNVKRFLKQNFWYVLAFCVPALVHLIGTHIEARYFYPCYALMYAYIGMICPWKDIWAYVKKRYISIVLISIAFFGLMNAIWNFTFESVKYEQLLIQDDYVIEELTKKEFVEEYNDNINIEYDVSTKDIIDGTYLYYTGSIYAVDRKSDESVVTLVLSTDNKQYLYDINLNEAEGQEEQYSKSRVSVKRELANLDDGEYEIGFIVKNGDESKAVLTGQTIKVEKQ